MATILVIDDSPRERANLAEPLRSLGHTVLEAGNGNDAIDVAREQRPDLCLVDDVMPGPSGVKTIKTLAEDARTAGVKCIYMHRADDETSRTWAMNAGAVDCLARPINSEVLLSLVARWAPATSAASIPPKSILPYKLLAYLLSITKP